VILRRYAAAPVAGDYRDSKGSELAVQPSNSDKAGRDKLRELSELKARVAEYFETNRGLIEPGDLPLYGWKLLLQAAVINASAQAKRQVVGWFELDNQQWDDRLKGTADVQADEFAHELLALMVAEWEPSQQEKFLGQFDGYVAEVTGGGDAGDDALAAESEMPSKYRPVSLTLPDAEISCEVYCIDGSVEIGLLGLDDAGNEVWLDNVSGEPLGKTVVGWEYFDDAEEVAS
jgi:hypothetical protein